MLVFASCWTANRVKLSERRTRDDERMRISESTSGFDETYAYDYG